MVVASLLPSCPHLSLQVLSPPPPTSSFPPPPLASFSPNLRWSGGVARERNCCVRLRIIALAGVPSASPLLVGVLVKFPRPFVGDEGLVRHEGGAEGTKALEEGGEEGELGGDVREDYLGDYEGGDVGGEGGGGEAGCGGGEAGRGAKRRVWGLAYHIETVICTSLTFHLRLPVEVASV